MVRTKELKSKPGANHLNLIQVNLTNLIQVNLTNLESQNCSKKTLRQEIKVKGSVAHPFQPRLVEEEGTGRSVLVDPINQVSTIIIRSTRLQLSYLYQPGLNHFHSINRV